ncbi:MAG: EcsC family protein [Myxococcales bacterium]|nr:EcsC family protein [Myxococcales bacterium]
MVADDLRAIAAAADYLENPRFLMRVADLVGRPAEALLKRLPDRAHRAMAKAVDAAMHKALDLAIGSLHSGAHGSPSLHSAGAAALGGVAGFFGLPGLAVELPLSTALMLRSIAAIAHSQGADLSDPGVRLECLTVLALGGQMPSPIDVEVQGSHETAHLDAMDSAYWTARLGLAVALRQAASHVATSGAARLTATDLAKGSSAAVGKLLAKVAARFQIVVSEKSVAQAVPVAGAVAGAALNAAFAEHFNEVARHHFGLRRLERQCGEAAVRKAYGAALVASRAGSPK